MSGCSHPPPTRLPHLPPTPTHLTPLPVPPPQIIPINSRPAWLMAMTGVFCAIGPCVLAGYFYFEKVYKRD